MPSSFKPLFNININTKLALSWLMLMMLFVGILGEQVFERKTPLIETDLLALLPKNQQDASAQIAFDHIAGHLSNQVILLVSGPDKTRSMQASQQLALQMSDLPLFSQVNAQFDQNRQQEWSELFFSKRFQLLTQQLQHQLQFAPQSRVEQVVQSLYNPFSGVTGQELTHDPFLLFRDYLAQTSQQSGRFSLQDGYLQAEYQGQFYTLITANLNGSPYSAELQNQLSQLQQLEQNIEQQYHNQVLHTGVIFYAAHGTQSAKNEISTIGVGSLVGIILLMLIVYRSILPLSLALLSITCGLITGFVVTSLIFGKVHLFSLVFGASLIGVSIDYAFHYLTDRLAAGGRWDAKQGLIHILTAITLGLITSLIGYLGMLVAPFPGLQQLSLFSAVGLMAAYACVVCWYPYLAKNPSSHELKRHRDLPFSAQLGRWLILWTQSSIRVVLPVIIILLAAIGIRYSHYNDDIRLLQSLPQNLKQQEELIKTISGVSNGQQMLLVKAQDSDQLLSKLQRISQDLQRKIEQGQLQSYHSLSQYLPSQEQQLQNFKLVQRLYQQQGENLRQVLKLKQPIEFEGQFSPLTIEQLLASPAYQQLSFMWLGELAQLTQGPQLEAQLGHIQAAVITLNGVTDVPALKQYAEQDLNISYLDKADEVSELFGHYRTRVSELLLLASLMIFVVLGWRYGMKKSVLIMLPPAIACCAGLAITALTGVPLNLFNLLALILILGVGIDYTLFFTEVNIHNPTRAKSTLLAITLSALTTILSFGLLALSHTQAIHSFGITVLCGILVSWLLAPMCIPSQDPSQLPKGQQLK